jgi:exopolysaccharide production protein ExoY
MLTPELCAAPTCVRLASAPIGVFLESQHFYSLRTRYSGWRLYLQSVQSSIGSEVLEFPKVQGRQSVWHVMNFIERAAAGLLLIALFPILLVAAIVLVAISRRSPLVAHQRVGQGGRQIWVLKLRTIWKGHSGKPFVLVHRLSPSDAPLMPPNQKNARVTSRFAAFCRRFSVDELPQLWNVVRGDMALVGPRPLTSEELETYYGPDAASVISAKPGLSGLWQITGRSRLNYRQRRRLDLFLIRNWSVSLYLRILVFTLPRVLTGKDAW